jgi:hypothetical protein
MTKKSLKNLYSKKKQAASKSTGQKVRDCSLNGDEYKNHLTSKAYSILKQTHDSTQHLLKSFNTIRGQRPGGHIGGTTDEEQDLLRSMLVTAATGLDAMVKQLIKDCLYSLSESKNSDGLVLKALTDFSENKLKTDVTGSINKEGIKFLAKVLVANSQKNAIVSECIKEWTSNSLQSANQLLSAMNSLGITDKEFSLEPQRLKLIFDIRNKIIHELDINFDAPKRNRNVRSMPRMIKETNYLLQIAENVLDSIKKRI